MKLVVLAATSILALTQVASAQANNAQPQSANSSQKNESVRQDIKSSLQQAGFTNISIMPEAFYIRAKDKSGNPVTISVDPNSFEEVATIPVGDSNTPSSPNAANNASQKAAMFTTVPQSDKLTSNLVGLKVFNKANQDIGEIKDVSIDQNGVEAYILAVGGFLGMGDHYVAVNPSALHVAYDSADKKWQASMNATADQLKVAPEFKYTGAWKASRM
jgi:hypothetical protein